MLLYLKTALLILNKSILDYGIRKILKVIFNKLCVLYHDYKMYSINSKKFKLSLHLILLFQIKEFNSNISNKKYQIAKNINLKEV